jgi:hypothetical protein
MDLLMLYLDLGRKVGAALDWLLLGVGVAIPVAVALGRVAAQADDDMPVVCEDDDEVTR